MPKRAVPSAETAPAEPKTRDRPSRRPQLIGQVSMVPQAKPSEIRPAVGGRPRKAKRRMMLRPLPVV